MAMAAYDEIKARYDFIKSDRRSDAQIAMESLLSHDQRDRSGGQEETFLDASFAKIKENFVKSLPFPL